MPTPPRKHTSDHFGIRQVRAYFDLKPIQYKKKKCLKCESEFISEGIGHRLCHSCNGYAVRVQQQEDMF